MTSRRRLFIGSLFFGLLLLLFLPTSGSVVAPAVIEPGPFARIFPPQAGKVRQLHVVPGDYVEAGAPLVSLDVPELEDRIRVLSLDEQRLRAAAETAGFSGERLAERLVLEQQLAQVQSAAASAREQLARSVIRAPFAGHVVDVQHLLHEGRWVASDMHLMTVAASGAPRIFAWLDEEGSARISAERGGYFYSGPGSGIPRLPVEIIQIENAPNTRLERNYHAAPYGGELATEKTGDGLEAVSALYRAHMAVTGRLRDLPRRRVKGWVYLETERVSPASRFWRWAVASVIREAGF